MQALQCSSGPQRQILSANSIDMHLLKLVDRHAGHNYGTTAHIPAGRELAELGGRIKLPINSQLIYIMYPCRMIGG